MATCFTFLSKPWIGTEHPQQVRYFFLGRRSSAAKVFFSDLHEIVKIYRSLNSNYNDKFESVVGTIITIKSNIADRSSLGSMAEIRDIHLKVQLTSEDVVAMRRVLQEHKIGAEGQARELAERDAQNFELRQEVATYQRQIVELSNGEA